MQPGQRSHASQNRKDSQENEHKNNLHDWINWLDKNVELAKRITLAVSDLQSNKQGVRSLREMEKNS